MSLDALFSPFTIKGLTLPNRIVMAPMTRTMPVDALTVLASGMPVRTSDAAGHNVSTPRSPSCAASRVVPSPTDPDQVVEHAGNWQLQSVPRPALLVNRAPRKTDTVVLPHRGGAGWGSRGCMCERSPR